MPVSQPELVGETIGGKYTVRRVLGGGGMGTVFEAEHLTIGRLVALKVLHPKHVPKREIVQRFYREARAAGRIDHPNICEVYDLDKLDDGSPYLVMERLVGETLARRMAMEPRLPLYELVDVLIQLLSALSAAHDKGIVHRDIKPENIFLAKRVGLPAQTKLLDFGVSKMTGALRGETRDDLELTRKGMVMGTPHYMSPEQACGDRDLDARVDLYACGVVLYQALTGQRPFAAANNRAVLHEVLTGRLRPARELRPALPPKFDAILAKAMARNREDRYRCASEFRSDLQAVRDVRIGFLSGAPRPQWFASLLARGSTAPTHDPGRSTSDEHPTRVWARRPRSALIDDLEPTHVMLRPLSLRPGDDHETIVRPRPGEAVSKQPSRDRSDGQVPNERRV
jgi:serine/threonine protein kinase